MSERAEPSRRTRIKDFVSRWRHLVLLVALLTLSVFGPLFGTSRRVGGIRLYQIYLAIVLLGSVVAISGSRRALIVGLVLLLPVFVLEILSHQVMSPSITVAAYVASTVFFAFVGVMVLADVLRAEIITADKIIGAACFYLFLGTIWAMLYAITGIVEPGALSFPESLRETAEGSQNLSNYFYFSFVTLTTLGYGDVTPLSRAARTLCWLEAVTGQLYIATLVARLVALHITQTRRGGAEK